LWSWMQRDIWMGALRFEDALWVTPEFARAKANTAVAFRTSTTELEDRWRERPLFATSVVNLSPGQCVVGKGAVPIVIDGTVVGAVGVSGGIPPISTTPLLKPPYAQDKVQHRASLRQVAVGPSA
jgi:hypothetical protein